MYVYVCIYINETREWVGFQGCHGSAIFRSLWGAKGLARWLGLEGHGDLHADQPPQSMACCKRLGARQDVRARYQQHLRSRRVASGQAVA